MQRPLSLFLALCLAVALVATSCRKDEDNPVKPGTNQPMVTTTIAGVIADENGNAMQGISVQAHGKTTTTNENGLFFIKDARVPKDRCFVLARKNGYFTASRAEQPKAGGVTHMRLSMMGNTPQYSVNASTGGKVSLAGGGSVELPANGFVLADGQAYTGTVRVAARWLNPVSSSFYGFFPGDFTAQRTDNSQTELYSYGVLNVELTSNAGAKVQLASGKKATLTYPVPSAMQAGAPSDMPLWYFDETLGMWKEDGKAVRQGNTYTGEVSHFTSWNCDVPTQTGFVRGRVECGGAAVSGIWVKVGQRDVLTDENGNYESRVPAGITFEISVEASQNLGSQTAAPVQAGPVTAQQTITQDLMISPCPAYLTGTLVDCNGNPTEGIVQATGTVGYGYAVVQNGTFRMRVQPNVSLSVEALGYNGATGEPLTVQQVTSGTTYNVGTVELCAQNAVTFTDLDINASDWGYSIALSPDGTLAAISGYENTYVYNVQSGSLLQTLPAAPGYAGTVAFSNDGTKLLAASNNDTVSTTTASTRVWNTSTWQEIRSFSGVRSSTFTPDGNSILAVTKDGSTLVVVQYSVATGAEIGRYTPPSLYGLVIAGVLANGTQFVYGAHSTGQVGKAFVWDMGTNTLVREIELVAGASIGDLRLSHDASILIARSWQEVCLYNVATGQKTNTIPLLGKERSRGFALAPNNTQYAEQEYPEPAALYTVATGNRVRLLPSPVQKLFVAFAYSSNGTRLAGMWNENQTAKVRVWQLP